MENNEYASRGRSSQKDNAFFDRNRFANSENVFGKDARKINENNQNYHREKKDFSNDDTFSKSGFKSGKKRSGINKSHNDNNKYNRKDKSFNSKTSKYSNNRKYDKGFNNDNKKVVEPEIYEDVQAYDLDANVRAQLKGLRKEVEEKIAKHLVMSGNLIDEDPQLAYEHACYALKCASRIPIIREAVALCSYQCGNYVQALRELRAYNRLTGHRILPSIEADCLRATGKMNQAVELISSLDMKKLSLQEQVEVIIVSANLRYEMGQADLALQLFDNTLANLASKSSCEEYKYRLLEAKATMLEQLGENQKAQEIFDMLPEEEVDILDLDELGNEQDHIIAPAGSDIPLCKLYDLLLSDLDGVCYRGNTPVQNAPKGMNGVRQSQMHIRFVTNNASKTPEQVAEKLNSFGIQAYAHEITTSALDIANIMKDELDESSKVLVVGGFGLRKAVENVGFTIVESADDNPDAVVQGFETDITWENLNEVAYAIEKGAKYYASNIDSTVPTERGNALGNGSLVAAVQHATGKKPKSGGKPFANIFAKAKSTCPEAKNPIAIGDRLGTDIAGANAANYPSMHVLTGVNDARDVAFASVENRPTYLALDATGLLQSHPYVSVDKDGYFFCDDSQKVRVDSDGRVEIDGRVLEDETTISLNTYRAYVAAIWDAKDNRNMRIESPVINVVENS